MSGGDALPITAGHRIQEALLVGVGGLARLLPEGWSQRLGAGLGHVVGSVLRIRRSTVDENLARAFPDWSARRRRKVAVAAYRHLGREGIALLRLGAMPPDELLKRTTVRGGEALEEALENGGGVVLLAGHLGNWELAGAALAVRGAPLDVVGKRQRNPLFDRRIRGMREGFGMRPVFREEATRPLLKGLREGRAAALVADQNVQTGGIFIDFFGRPASAARGPGVLALRTGAPPIFVGVRRLPGPRIAYELELISIPLPDSGDPEADTRHIVQSFHTLLEEAVRRAPEQYFWFHRRWKTRPPDEGASPVSEPDGIGPV